MECDAEQKTGPEHLGFTVSLSDFKTCGGSAEETVVGALRRQRTLQWSQKRKTATQRNSPPFQTPHFDETVWRQRHDLSIATRKTGFRLPEQVPVD